MTNSVNTVSVIIPCYNHGAVISAAIESLRSQTFNDYEVVIVNDGSDDGRTEEVLAGFAAEGLTVCHKKNGGAASARNFGIKKSCGEFIFSLDADDQIEPGLFEKAVARLRDNPKVGIVTCGVVVQGVSNGTWMPKGSLSSLLAISDIAPGSMFRRRCWEDVGGYDESFKGMEDYDLWLSIIEKGWEIDVIDEYLHRYNQSANGLCRTVVHRNRDLHLKLLKKHGSSYLENWLEVICELQLKHEEMLDNLNKLIGIAGHTQKNLEKNIEKNLKKDLKNLENVKNLERNIENLEKNLDRTRNCLSYKLGMALTSPARKVARYLAAAKKNDVADAL